MLSAQGLDGVFAGGEGVECIGAFGGQLLDRYHHALRMPAGRFSSRHKIIEGTLKGALAIDIVIGMGRIGLRRGNLGHVAISRH